MRWFCWILIAIALLPAAGLAQALPDNPQPATSGASGWNRVQDLANGEGISVARRGERSVPCRFAGATDESLFCDSFYTGRPYQFDRVDVKRVRRDDKRRNLTIVLGSFTAAGFIWGVATPPERGTPRMLDGVAGAALGAMAGVIVGVPSSLLIPGRVVYRQRVSDRKMRSPSLKTTPQPAP